MSFSTMLALIVTFVIVVGILKAVRMVPQGFEWTVEAFGKYTHTLSPGLHFLVPIYQSVGRKINMTKRCAGIPVALRNSVLKCDTLKSATSASSDSARSRARFASM